MHKIHGYELDDIEPLAQDIFQLIAENEVPQPHALVALCRTIVMMATEEDLDIACTLIDRIAEAVAEDQVRDFEEEEDGQN